MERPNPKMTPILKNIACAHHLLEMVARTWPFVDYPPNYLRKVITESEGKLRLAKTALDQLEAEQSNERQPT